MQKNKANSSSTNGGNAVGPHTVQRRQAPPPVYNPYRKDASPAVVRNSPSVQMSRAAIPPRSPMAISANRAPGVRVTNTAGVVQPGGLRTGVGAAVGATALGVGAAIFGFGTLGIGFAAVAGAAVVGGGLSCLAPTPPKKRTRPVTPPRVATPVSHGKGGKAEKEESASGLIRRRDVPPPPERFSDPIPEPSLPHPTASELVTLQGEAQQSGSGVRDTLQGFLAEVRSRYQLNSAEVGTLTTSWRAARNGGGVGVVVPVAVAPVFYGPPPRPPFDANNHTTWNLLPPVLVDGVTNGDVNGVTLTPTDQANLAAIMRGERVTNASTGGSIGVAYHTHMSNNGGGGLAFYYRRVGVGFDVAPVIYAVADSRNGNVYQWRHGYPASNSHPVRPGGLV